MRRYRHRPTFTHAVLETKMSETRRRMEGDVRMGDYFTSQSL